MISDVNNTPPRSVNIFEHITIDVENKCSQLANLVATLKNSVATFFTGSETKRQQNTKKICGELIQRISTQKKDHGYEVLDIKKMNDNKHISTRFTHKTLDNTVTELFCSVKNELLNQTDKKLSLTKGHSDESVNIMLAALYQIYEQADKFLQKNINFGYNSLLKTRIFELIINNFIIENIEGATQNDKLIELLKNMHDIYKYELNSYKEISKEKIEYKIERFGKLQDNLKEYIFYIKPNNV
ncbi:hypothetical protein [Proteus terrae]|uniref:hypothetical protein n=3 Tax=Proteus terrae TaxID=1574161 RepID=UPI0018E73A72|nr:hypothetical protein [Proteus terrae]MBJ2108189.1 hypothetical protein [Proteus terrae]MBJ2132061.1 hypothetical protein [Proteus terrae]MCT8229887.1 hypothetical protein [Proteus terrae]